MANSVELQVKVQTSATDFWNALYNATEVFPNALNFTYRRITTKRGDGKSPSTVRAISYGEDSAVIRVSEERIDEANSNDKKLSCTVTGGDLLKYFRSFKYTVVVTQQPTGSLVKWTCEFEVSNPSAVPVLNVDVLVKTILGLDDYLQNMRPL